MSEDLIAKLLKDKEELLKELNELKSQYDDLKIMAKVMRDQLDRLSLPRA